MKTTSNNNSNENNNGMSQVINILTGETKKIRCHYISSRTDKPVSRVLTLERLNHPALTAAGVTAWAERFNDGVNSFDWLRVSIQLTEKICYTPNCANVGLPDVENYGNLDYYMGQEGAMLVYMNNVDKFFQSIADKPAKMMTGENWPNMAVIAAYHAAGRDEEAETLTTARDIYNARREAKNEAWQKEWEEKKRKEQEKQNSFTEGMRVTVPAASLTDGEAFVIVTIRRKAADNGGNASLTVKNETTGDVRNINGSDVHDILPPLEPASEINASSELGIKVGDRVKVKSQDTPANVTAISEDGKYFTVKFLQPVRGFWTDNTMQTATYSRYGITRNYDRMTGEEIVGNAQYYAEQLKYGPGSVIEYEFAGVALRTESTREDVEPDSREGWGNEFRVTIHHQTGDTTESMTLSETAELLARMYQEEHGKAA